MIDALAAVIRFASATAGVDFGLYREPTIRRRLDHRMRMRHCDQLADYAALLENDRAERWLLADALLIKTTHAFRDQATWRALRSSGVPDLLARCVRRGGPTLTAWVAGCSTGEEAYSYAMALLEARERASVEIDVRVVATDVDVCALEHAARGVYDVEAFGQTPPALAARYLSPVEARRVAVTDALREVVTLSRHDLTVSTAAPLPAAVFASFDLVSCCNVLLYLDDSSRAATYARLVTSCETDGLFVVGEAEYPPRGLPRRLVPIAETAHAFRVLD